MKNLIFDVQMAHLNAGALWARSNFSGFKRSTIAAIMPVEKVKCLYISARQWRRMS